LHASFGFQSGINRKRIERLGAIAVAGRSNAATPQYLQMAKLRLSLPKPTQTASNEQASRPPKAGRLERRAVAVRLFVEFILEKWTARVAEYIFNTICFTIFATAS
jgi:hypothetical protein